LQTRDLQQDVSTRGDAGGQCAVQQLVLVPGVSDQGRRQFAVSLVELLSVGLRNGASRSLYRLSNDLMLGLHFGNCQRIGKHRLQQREDDVFLHGDVPLLSHLKVFEFFCRGVKRAMLGQTSGVIQQRFQPLMIFRHVLLEVTPKGLRNLDCCRIELRHLNPLYPRYERRRLYCESQQRRSFTKRAATRKFPRNKVGLRLRLDSSAQTRVSACSSSDKKSSASGPVLFSSQGVFCAVFACRGVQRTPAGGRGPKARHTAGEKSDDGRS